MRQILQIRRGGYYDWQCRAASERSRRDQVLLKEIRKIHQDSKKGSAPQFPINVTQKDVTLD
jgi:hypothetical protein